MILKGSCCTSVTVKMNKIQVAVLLLSFSTLAAGLQVQWPVNSQTLKPNLYNLLENIDRISSKQLTAELDEYFDILLPNVNEFILQQNLEPSSVPDVKHKFKWTVVLLPIYGQISMKNGNFSGFSTMYRRKGTVVTYENETLSIRVPLGFKQLEVDYDYSASLMGLGPSGGIKGVIKTFKMTLQVSINLHHLIFDLTEFSVDGSGLIYTEFSGFILTDLILEILSSVVVNLFRGIILNEIEDGVHHPLEKLIGDLNNGISNVLRP